MTNYIYTVSLHISRCDTCEQVFSNVPYNSNFTGKGDTIKFTRQKITIRAERTKKYKSQDILGNVRNSIYRQIVKSIIYLYTENQCRIRIRSIDVIRETRKTKYGPYSITVSNHEQPIKDDFPLLDKVQNLAMENIWKEGFEGDMVRSILAHWLCALASMDRIYIFEHLWRAFERLCFYSIRGEKDKNEFNAIKNMRGFICNNPHLFDESIRQAHKVSGRKFRNFDWEGYIINEFRPLHESKKAKPYTEKYKEHFVKCNKDFRVLGMLKKTLPLRKKELQEFDVYYDIYTHIDHHLKSRSFYDEHLLCMLCCKYAYYLRNRIFHGEIIDYTFTFSNATLENKNLDIINTLLNSVISDLMFSFDQL